LQYAAFEVEGHALDRCCFAGRWRAGDVELERDTAAATWSWDLASGGSERAEIPPQPFRVQTRIS